MMGILADGKGRLEVYPLAPCWIHDAERAERLMGDNEMRHYLCQRRIVAMLNSHHVVNTDDDDYP